MKRSLTNFLKMQNSFFCLFSLLLLPLKKVAFGTSIGIIVNLRSERALLFYFPLFFFSQLLQSIIFLTHIIEQSLKHIFLEIPFFLNNMLRYFTNNRNTPRLSAIFFPFQPLQIFLFLSHYLLKPFVYRSQITIPFHLFFVDIWLERTVFLILLSCQTGVFNCILHL